MERGAETRESQMGPQWPHLLPRVGQEVDQLAELVLLFLRHPRLCPPPGAESRQGGTWPPCPPARAASVQQGQGGRGARRAISTRWQAHGTGRVPRRYWDEQAEGPRLLERAETPVLLAHLLSVEAQSSRLGVDSHLRQFASGFLVANDMMRLTFCGGALGQATNARAPLRRASARVVCRRSARKGSREIISAQRLPREYNQKRSTRRSKLMRVSRVNLTRILAFSRRRSGHRRFVYR